jgi:hypothetical protein
VTHVFAFGSAQWTSQSPRRTSGRSHPSTMHVGPVAAFVTVERLEVREVLAVREDFLVEVAALVGDFLVAITESRRRHRLRLRR